MTKPPRGRLSLRETIQRNQQALDVWAELSGKPRVELRLPPEPKKRAAPVPSGEPSEAEVQSAVVQLLRTHPRVAWFGRFNSGSAVAEHTNGDKRYTAFYRLYLRGMAARSRGLSDVMGQLTDGRLFILEIKSRRGRATPEQNEFIDVVLKAGGIAGIVRSVDDVVALLA